MRLNLERLKRFDMEDPMMIYEFLYQLSIMNVDEIKRCCKYILKEYFGVPDNEFAKKYKRSYKEIEYPFNNVLTRVFTESLIILDFKNKHPNETELIEDFVFDNDFMSAELAIENFFYTIWKAPCTNVRKSASELYKLICISDGEYNDKIISFALTMNNDVLREYYYTEIFRNSKKLF